MKILLYFVDRLKCGFETKSLKNFRDIEEEETCTMTELRQDLLH